MDSFFRLKKLSELDIKIIRKLVQTKPIVPQDQKLTSFNTVLLFYFF